MPEPSVIAIERLGFQWPALDPFLFCVHHQDAYPRGNELLGPAAPLDGRRLGEDFEGRDGWRMYHGERVPGFPAHPHRGFETVTIVLRGFVDHSDSHGSRGRYGEGDVQWMTAGSGLQHAEMFPLLRQDADNPLELFQIWLNLPRARKFVDPYYTMLWSEHIPLLTHRDGNGFDTRVTLVAGDIGDLRPPAPAPSSYAAMDGSGVAIWIVTMDAHAQWPLPPAPERAERMLYFFEGEGMEVDGTPVPAYHAARLRPGADVRLRNGGHRSRLLLLQGVPLDEPVVQHGPFVMNSREEIMQAMVDYQRTRFGGWPWKHPDVVHARDTGRFATYADGRTERPGSVPPDGGG